MWISVFRDKRENSFLSVSYFETRTRICSLNLGLWDKNEKFCHSISGIQMRTRIYSFHLSCISFVDLFQSVFFEKRMCNWRIEEEADIMYDKGPVHSCRAYSFPYTTNKRAQLSLLTAKMAKKVPPLCPLIHVRIQWHFLLPNLFVNFFKALKIVSPNLFTNWQQRMTAIVKVLIDQHS